MTSKVIMLLASAALGVASAAHAQLPGLPGLPGIGGIGGGNDIGHRDALPAPPAMNTGIVPPRVFPTAPCVTTAFGSVGCASEATLIQLANYQAQATAIAEDSRQIQNQIRHILDTRMDVRLQRMIEPLPGSTWASIGTAIGRLSSLNTQAQNLAFQAQQSAQTAEQYFPAYGDIKPGQFFQDYKRIADNTRAQVIKALQNADFAVDDFASVNGTIAALRARNDNVVGQTQALQVSNKIALLIADQMTRLRIAMKAQTDAHTAFVSHQLILEQRKTKIQENFWRVETDKLKPSALPGLPGIP